MQSKYFKIHELVPKHIYYKFGDNAWRFIDEKLIETIDTLKEHFSSGTITINNYSWGGDREWSGLRTPESIFYSETSMHSFGKAVDMVFSDYSSDEVRLYIKKNKIYFPHVKGIEEDITWVHLDVRNEEYLTLFSP